MLCQQNQLSFPCAAVSISSSINAPLPFVDVTYLIQKNQEMLYLFMNLLVISRALSVLINSVADKTRISYPQVIGHAGASGEYFVLILYLLSNSFSKVISQNQLLRSELV